MKNLKKVLALVIAFTMMLGFGVSASVFPDVADDASYAEAVTILSAMEIMIGDNNGNFRPDDTITRAEATAIIVRAKGLEDASNGAKGATQFSDVAADHWATGYINLAAQSGIVNGYTDGTFRPEEPVAYEQIVKMIVAALGYEPKAAVNGGYPTGYLVIAAQEKINQGAAGSAGEPAKRSVVARLTFNALTVKMMDVTEYGDELKWTQTNKTLLKDSLDTHVLEGVVAGTFLTASTIVPDNKDITINVARFNDNAINPAVANYDGRKIVEKDVDVASYIGQYVTAYISEDKDKNEWNVIAVAPKTGKNEIVELDYSALESFNGTNKVEYLPEGSKSIVEIEFATSPVKVYNGRLGQAASVDTFLAQGSVLPGSVKFIDNNNDDLIDYIFVTEYKADYVVKEVGTSKLTDKDDNSVPYVDMRDESRVVRFFKDGAVIDFADIAAGDIITLAYAADKLVINAYITNATVTGAVAEKRDNNGDPAYAIDGKEYRVTTGGPSITVGEEGTFYLNVDNRIVYKETTAAQVGNYAYMYTAHLGNDIDGKVVKVKFFTAKGEWVTAPVAKKVKVWSGSPYAGVAATDAAAANYNAGIYTVNAGATAATAVQGVFKYSMNAEGEINNIYMLAAANNKDYFSKDKTITGGTYNADDLRIGATYFGADNVVFSVPANGLLTDEEDIAVTTVGTLFQDDVQYNADLYDIVDGYASLIVAKGAQTDIDDSTRVLVISGIASAKDANDNDVTRVYGYQAGQAVDGLTSDDVTFYDAAGVAVGAPGCTLAATYDADDLKAGDIVIFSLNADGEINKVKVLLAYADAKTKIAGMEAGTPGSAIYNSGVNSANVTVTNMFGFAAKKESGNILNITSKFVNNAGLIDANLINADNGKPIMYRAATPANFYSINTERANAVPEVITYADLEANMDNSTASYKTEGSYVYVRQLDGVVTDVVVFTSYNPL